jgi:hypothetical protein
MITVRKYIVCMKGVLFMYLLSIVAETTARSVITFHDSVGCLQSHRLPECTTVVKCYGRRLVVDTNGCNVDTSSMSVWIEEIFGVDIIEMIEEDATVKSSLSTVHGTTGESQIDLVVGKGIPISLESPEWLDREWIVTSEYGIGTTSDGSSATLVAILDSGLPALALGLFANIVDGYDFISDPSISNDGDGRESNWHDPGDSATACPGDSSWHGMPPLS